VAEYLLTDISFFAHYKAFILWLEIGERVASDNYLCHFRAFLKPCAD
jgi:hypothetical protein